MSELQASKSLPKKTIDHRLDEEMNSWVEETVEVDFKGMQQRIDWLETAITDCDEKLADLR